jgi:aspartate kinase
MKVLKFGGTSLADRSRIEASAQIVIEARQHDRVLVVASAVAGTTNRLVKLAGAARRAEKEWQTAVCTIERKHLGMLVGLSATARQAGERSVREIVSRLHDDLEILATGSVDRFEVTDRVLAAGERLSVPILAAVMQSMGCAARTVDAADAIVTDSSFGEAKVDFENTLQRCRRLFDGRDKAIPVVTGYVGSDPYGRTTTLGRGGSDYSAAVLGAVLDVDHVEIWTDVDGVLTAPPLLVPNVSSIPWLSYEEAAELSYFGARVIHPQTVRPLADRGIPIYVRNSMDPGRKGTEIAVRNGNGSRVVAVSAYEDVTAFSLRRASLAEVGEVLMSCCASADGTVLVAVPSSKHGDLVGRFGQAHSFEASIVTLVGHDIALQPWVAGRALESLARRNIAVRSFAAGASPHTVALLVDRRDFDKVLRTVHDALMLDRQEHSANGVGSRAKEVHHVTAA